MRDQPGLIWLGISGYGRGEPQENWLAYGDDAGVAAGLSYAMQQAAGENVFVGDAIFPGGNDYPAKQAGVVSIEVRDPHETKRVIEAVIACLQSGVGR